MTLIEVREDPHEEFRPQERGLTRIRCFSVVLSWCSCRVVVIPKKPKVPKYQNSEKVTYWPGRGLFGGQRYQNIKKVVKKQNPTPGPQNTENRPKIRKMCQTCGKHKVIMINNTTN